MSMTLSKFFWFIRIFRGADLPDQAGKSLLSTCPKNGGNFTSKWNKIEHRLFSFITQNWRGKPLRNLETIVNLIGATTTSAGLTVKARVDTNLYDTGIRVSDEKMARLRIVPHKFHGECNYTIKPKSKT